ncbi:MAG: bifunctional 4-hydroxy-3-methylbut-2-enyl diphosphate reductase/30S ribosomal protein S1 [Clostridia bacterium]|nr:bifunctional 4-hydroxy-3-methylbut-2-enyl diphosphate reductase/30S ribosomal protein S1 [Clostridia bacterium]
MEITLAKTAGFCFGVDRAVKLLEEHLAAGEKAATLGPLIHNPDFIASLQARGVSIVDTPAETPPDTTLFIRTHGVPKAVTAEIERLSLPYRDVTCPFVKRIHEIVQRQSAMGDVILIAGDPQHPEVTGIKSYAETPVFVCENAGALQELYEKNAFSPEKNVSLVSQTTFDAKEFKKIEKNAKKLYTNLKIFGTICNATSLRQEEAQRLSLERDMVIVIGGRNSSNTEKLYRICSENTRAYLIENAAELSAINFNGVSTVGVTAGASTPDSIIKEVVKTMSEINENIGTVVEAAEQAATIADPEEVTFEQALEESLNSMSNDQQVVGTVMHIAPNEIQVDIGRKQTGYIPIDEYSADPTADPMTELKVGDELNLIIMKTNDAEGTIMLSKRRYDAVKYWDSIVEAYEAGTILEGTVVEVISKGLIVFVDGIRIFVPASQSTVPRDGRLEEMLNKDVKFKVIDIDRRRRRAVGSIRDAYRAERKEAKDKFWAEAAVGQKYTGKVKSLTDYGAFVELAPGVDGMIHRTELSWKRIKHPSDVVAVGDVVDVYIKALDTEKKKISLGYKKIEDNPWEILRRDYPIGSEITVKIVRMTTFGAFAEIFPKMEGLIHISQISNERIEKPQDVISIGDEVKVKITDIDFDKKRISLSMKALLPPPERKHEDRRSEHRETGPAVLSIDELIAKANAADAKAAEAAEAAEEAPAEAAEAAAETVVEEAAAEAVAEAAEEAPAAE